MLTAHFVKDQSLDISLPEAESAQSLDKDEALKITLEGQNELAELFKKKDKKIISEIYLMKRPAKI